MYVDYKFWYDTKTKVVTLDEEMNLNIPNGEMFEFRNNQFFANTKYITPVRFRLGREANGYYWSKRKQWRTL